MNKVRKDYKFVLSSYVGWRASYEISRLINNKETKLLQKQLVKTRNREQLVITSWSDMCEVISLLQDIADYQKPLAVARPKYQITTKNKVRQWLQILRRNIEEGYYDYEN